MKKSFLFAMALMVGVASSAFAGDCCAAKKKADKTASAEKAADTTAASAAKAADTTAASAQPVGGNCGDTSKTATLASAS